MLDKAGLCSRVFLSDKRTHLGVMILEGRNV
jgi:hypothetical protein